MAAEQQDGLAEPRSAERGDLVGTAGALDESDEPRRRHEALLRGGPADISRERRIVRAGPIATELDDDRRPALEQRSRRRVGWSATCPVSLEPLKVEAACPQTERPAPDRARGDTATLGDVGHRRTIREHLGNRIEDYLDAGDLARQRVAWEYALSVPAIVAACQRHRQRREGIGRFEPTINPTASEPDILAAARGTATARKKILLGTGESGGVSARLYVEYENHRAHGGPVGVQDRTGAAAICGAHPRVTPAQLCSAPRARQRVALDGSRLASLEN